MVAMLSGLNLYECSVPMVSPSAKWMAASPTCAVQLEAIRVVCTYGEPVEAAVGVRVEEQRRGGDEVLAGDVDGHVGRRVVEVIEDEPRLVAAAAPELDEQRPRSEGARDLL